MDQLIFKKGTTHMDSVLGWILGSEKHYQEKTPEFTAFFSQLDKISNIGSYPAIIQAARQFEGELLEEVIGKLCVQYKFNINQQDAEGKSALHGIMEISYRGKSSYKTEFKRLYFFLEKGIDPNLRDNDGNTLLHLIAQQMPLIKNSYMGDSPDEYLEFISYLIKQKGADLTLKNKCGDTALDELVRYGDNLAIAGNKKNDINVVQFFLNLAKDVNHIARLRTSRTIDGNSSLHIAAISGGPKTVQLLLQEGWNINCKNKEGATPLHYAIFGIGDKYEKVVKCLSNWKGVDINAKINKLDYTAFDITIILSQYISQYRSELNRDYLKIKESLASKVTGTKKVHNTDFDQNAYQALSEFLRYTYPRLGFMSRPHNLCISLNSRYDEINVMFDPKKTEQEDDLKKEETNRLRRKFVNFL
jgi:ankyrin repeat protein